MCPCYNYVSLLPDIQVSEGVPDWLIYLLQLLYKWFAGGPELEKALGKNTGTRADILCKTYKQSLPVLYTCQVMQLPLHIFKGMGIPRSLDACII